MRLIDVVVTAAVVGTVWIGLAAFANAHPEPRKVPVAPHFMGESVELRGRNCSWVPDDRFNSIGRYERKGGFFILKRICTEIVRLDRAEYLEYLFETGQIKMFGQSR